MRTRKVCEKDGSAGLHLSLSLGYVQSCAHASGGGVGEVLPSGWGRRPSGRRRAGAAPGMRARHCGDVAAKDDFGISVDWVQPGGRRVAAPATTAAAAAADTNKMGAPFCDAQQRTVQSEP